MFCVWYSIVFMMFGFIRLPGSVCLPRDFVGFLAEKVNILFVHGNRLATGKSSLKKIAFDRYCENNLEREIRLTKGNSKLAPSQQQLWSYLSHGKPAHGSKRWTLLDRYVVRPYLVIATHNWLEIARTFSKRKKTKNKARQEVTFLPFAHFLHLLLNLS